MQTVIRLEMAWIPREKNQQADYLSRLVDHDDWMVNPHIFQWIDSVWGPDTIDRFATHYNRHLPRFNSRFWNPDTEAVDAFTCNWSGENNWLCPPIYLIPRVLRHAANPKAVATLVVPEWISSPYWLMLCPDGLHLSGFVHLYAHTTKCRHDAAWQKRCKHFQSRAAKYSCISPYTGFYPTSQSPRQFRMGILHA